MKKIALIGNGYWGSKIRKYVGEYFELKYVANSKFDKTVIWKDDSVCGVIIATPIETHYDIAKEALIYGKHVLVEKPFTLKEKEAVHLKEIAKNNNVNVGVEYTQTFSKSINKMTSSIHEIGKMEFIEMSTKHLGRFMNHDVFWLLASHHLSILDMIVPIDKIRVIRVDCVNNRDICTTGTLNLYNCSVNKNVGKIDVSLNYPAKDMHINIYGSIGTIKWNPDKIPTLEITTYNKTYMDLPEKLVLSKKQFKYDERDNLLYSMKYFNDLMDGKAESNIDTAIKITRILEQCQQY